MISSHTSDSSTDSFKTIVLNQILPRLPLEITSSLPSPLEILSIIPLTGGLTNSNHLLSIRNHHQNKPFQIVIREISKSSTINLKIDRISEIKNSILSFQWGISPRLFSVIYDLDEKPKFMLFDYMKGKTLSNGEIQKMCEARNQTEKIVKVLKILHGSGELEVENRKLGERSSSTFENRFDLRKVRNEYLEICRKECWELPEGYRELESSFQEVLSVLDPHDSLPSTSTSRETLVPCHNDLLAANFILLNQSHEDQNQIKLIDWEYSGLNYPSFDLGNFYSENELSEQQLGNLIKTYWNFEKLNQNQVFIEKNDERSFIKSKIARAKLWASLAQMCWIVWATIQYNSICKEHDNLIMISETIGEKEKQLKIEIEMKKKEYLDWREVKMISAKRLLSESGRLERELLIKEILREDI